jgi:hypothetical protein
MWIYPGYRARRRSRSDMTVTNEHLAYRPGGVSSFFIYKAGFMAVGFWTWLGVLAVRGDAPSAWQLVAASGAITTTLVGVILGVRYALARHAAARHEQIMQTLVELSWQAFTPPAVAEAPSGGDADVIRLQHESRPRPRR